MEPFKLHDAEFKFVNLVWETEPINSTELTKLALSQLGWKKSTTYTVLRKLCERKILRNEDATVSSAVNREDVLQYESSTIIDKTFSGSLPHFLTAFLGDRKISEKEAAELKKIIEEATK